MEKRTSDERRVSPLDIAAIEAEEIERIVIEFDSGETETITPKQREVFGAYELYESAHYIHNLSGHMLKGS